MTQVETAASGSVMFVSSIARYGGGERWMSDAALGLKRRGHDVQLVARPGSPLQDKAVSLGIDTTAVEMRSDLDPRAITRLTGLIGRALPDVICVNLDREVRLCAIALALAKRIHRRGLDETRLIPRRGSEFPLKDNFRYRIVYNRFVDCVITNSNATKKTMLSRTSWFPRAKATVIYNGIDLDDYDRLGERKPEIRQWFRRSLGLERDACLITLIGELNERKGHRFVIGAAREIIDEHPHARFLFVGDGDARVHIERLLDEGGLRDRCLMLGFRSDVPDILTASDILVLPSRVEGFGYVLVEAMAARLPVVASNTSSIPEIVTHGETGYLHDMGDQQAIAVCLKRLLVDPGLRQSMGEAGYQVVKRKFSYAVMIDQLEQLFFEQRPHEKAGGG